MHILQLKISDKVYERFMWLLSKFNADEIEVVSEKSDFESTSNYLQEELKDIELGKANFISQQEFENRINKVI